MDSVRVEINVGVSVSVFSVRVVSVVNVSVSVVSASIKAMVRSSQGLGYG